MRSLHSMTLGFLAGHAFWLTVTTQSDFRWGILIFSLLALVTWMLFLRELHYRPDAFRSFKRLVEKTREDAEKL